MGTWSGRLAWGLAIPAAVAGTWVTWDAVTAEEGTVHVEGTRPQSAELPLDGPSSTSLVWNGTAEGPWSRFRASLLLPVRVHRCGDPPPASPREVAFEVSAVVGGVPWAPGHTTDWMRIGDPRGNGTCVELFETQARLQGQGLGSTPRQVVVNLTLGRTSETRGTLHVEAGPPSFHIRPDGSVGRGSSLVLAGFAAGAVAFAAGRFLGGRLDDIGGKP